MQNEHVVTSGSQYLESSITTKQCGPNAKPVAYKPLPTVFVRFDGLRKGDHIEELV